MQPHPYMYLPKFDIVASYDISTKTKRRITNRATNVAGVQWWFYPKCRLQAQYTYCDPHKGAKLQPAAGTIAGAFLIYENILAFIFVHL